MLMYIIWVIILAVYGLIIGSFINAFVWRFHETHDDDLKPKKLSKKQQAELSIVKGRSMCPSCKHQLSGGDLIPIFSWVALSGKCRYCKKPISAQYPLVELTTALLFVLSYLSWPYELVGIGLVVFIIWLVVVGLFVVLGLYDIKWQLLPDKIVFPFVAVSLMFGILLLFVPSAETASIVGYLGGVLVCSGVFAVIYQISDGKWIGGGDVKLGLGLGILAGSLLGGVLVLMISSIVGIIFAIPMLLNNKIKMKSKISYGPLLILATFVVFLYGQLVIDWYLDLLMI